MISKLISTVVEVNACGTDTTILSQNLPGRNEENHKNLQSR
jgi:hypothetical protein